MRFVILLVLVLAPLVSLRAEVRVVGCDLLGKPFATSLTEYSRRSDLGVTLALTGSASGWEQLQDGRADLALIMLAPGEKLPEAPFLALPVAYHTITVVVPASLPLTQITFAQLNAIYADGAESTLKRWSDLGVVGEWANRNILPNITGADVGITYDLFRYTVLRSPALKPTVVVQNSAEAALRRITGEEGGIAIMPLLPSSQPGLKALLVARGPKDVAFGPTEDNVHSGDYPVRLPLYLVFRKDKAKSLQVVLRYLLSEEATPLWANARLVPLPVQARNQQIFDLELL
ncbi:MAG: substrate-binding domain-containing protein [Verrucomicrobia bacterium]|nr:substrate-binding domain-containing protein [Verrucomicrobiota bacterium]